MDEDRSDEATALADRGGAARRGLLERTASEVLGWALVVVGVPLMPLPGPGSIVILAGVALLARNHAWARRALGPLQRSAIAAAKYGVATWPRIALSVAGGAWIAALGVVWIISPTIPEFSVLGLDLGPQLPAAGVATGVGILTSAVAAWALLAYSVIRWHGAEREEAAAEAAAPVAA